jgi:hypothetical protein
MLQLAHGWTTLSVRINVFGAVLLAPAVYLGVVVDGLTGAAAAWALMNALILVLGTVVMHRRLLRDQLLMFVRDAVVVPLAASCLAVGVVVLILKNSLHGRFEALGIVVASGIFALFAAGAATPIGRHWLRLSLSVLETWSRARARKNGTMR